MTLDLQPRSRRCLRAAFLPLLGLLVSCSVTPQGEINEIYRDAIEQRAQTYKIKEGDVVDIVFYSPRQDSQQQALNQDKVLVLPDGTSDLFFMPSAQMAGKSIRELEKDLTESVSSEVREPEIRVQVQPAPETVYLYGDFERPAPLPLTTGMTLQEAIASVGGLRVTGDTDWALLRRPYRNPRHPDRFRIDLNDESEELVLLPGDQIWLGKNALGTFVHYFQQFITAIFPNPYYMFYSFGL